MSDYETTRPVRTNQRNDHAVGLLQPRLLALRNRERSPVTGHPSLVHSQSQMNGFTLAELLVSMSVLVLLVFLAVQLVNSAATVVILDHKRMDADSEARQVFDRLAVDFTHMLRRTDVDYYLKYSGQMINRNDQMAFYSAVPGYYPSGSTRTQQSPLSLVAYRVNNNPSSPSYNRLERLGKGLVWNGASTTNTPVVFLPFTIPNIWPYATDQSSPDPDGQYEVIGPDVFRFEYYYQLAPPIQALWDSPCRPTPCNVNAWRQVTAIVVDIAVIDPRSRLLLTEAQIATFNGNSGTSPLLVDFRTDRVPTGILIGRFWQPKLDGILTMPRQAVAGIRLYERYFYLNQ